MKPSRTPREYLTAFQRFHLHISCPMYDGARSIPTGHKTRDGRVVLRDCTFYGNGGKPFIEPERAQEPGPNAIARHKVLSTSRGACAMRSKISQAKRNLTP